MGGAESAVAESSRSTVARPGDLEHATASAAKTIASMGKSVNNPLAVGRYAALAPDDDARARGAEKPLPLAKDDPRPALALDHFVARRQRGRGLKKRGHDRFGRGGCLGGKSDGPTQRATFRALRVALRSA
jgi:hypothetical protein